MRPASASNLCILVVVFVVADATEAFTSRHTNLVQKNAYHRCDRKANSFLTSAVSFTSRNSLRLPLSSSNNNQMFDLSKPVFDVYAGRPVRGDALARYNTLNQSEPLRINLAAFGVLFFLALPALLDEVSRDPTTTISAIASSSDATASSSSSFLTLPQTLACYASATASAAVFWQQTRRRSRQLTRFERELQAVALTIRLPNSVLADRAYGQAQTIRALQQKQTARIVALYGTGSQLKEALQQLQVLRRRLVQSNTFVVAIPVAATTGSELNLARIMTS